MSTLVVLAAGLATRYGGTKQLEAVGPSGETLFDYAVYDAQRAGSTRVLFVVREELRRVFEAEVMPRWSDRLECALAVQRLDDVPGPYAIGRVKPWGTAHALLAAAAQLSGDVLVCNADDFYGEGAYRALASALRQPDAAHAVAGYRVAGTLSEHGGVTRAVCRTDPQDWLYEIEECTGIRRTERGLFDDRDRELDPEALVSMNLWAFRESFFRSLSPEFERFLAERGHDPSAEFRLPDTVNERVRAGERVRVVPVDEHWFGMTYGRDLDTVRQRIAARVIAGDYPANLFTTE